MVTENKFPTTEKNLKSNFDEKTKIIMSFEG